MKRAISRKRQHSSISKPTYERFEPRHLLAVLTGTESDDVVSVTASGETLEVDLNGDLYSYNFSDDPILEFDGLGGSDLVTLGTTDSLPVEFVDGALKVGLFTVELANVESVDVANDGRILINGSSDDDQFVLSHSPTGSSVSINGNEFPLPLTETGLPLQIGAGSGSDSLVLRTGFETGTLQMKLHSAIRSGLIDSAWTGVERVELEFESSNTYFQLISDDASDVLYVNSDRLTLESEVTTFEVARNSAVTAFWHSGGESNQAFVSGTEGDDTYNVIYDFNQPTIRVNENHWVHLNRASITIDGKGGHDSAQFNLDEDWVAYVESAVIEPDSIAIEDFPVLNLVDVESRTAGNIDEVTILDSGGDDHIEASDTTVVSNVGGATWTVVDNNSVLIESTGGHDSVVAYTGPELRPPVYNFLGFGIQYGNFNQRFLTTGFDQITVRAAEPGGLAYYFGDSMANAFDVSDPNGNLLVEHNDRTPALFEGEMGIHMEAYATEVSFSFDSQFVGSQVQAKIDEIEVNGNKIALVNFDYVGVTGNDSQDRLSLVGSSESDRLRSGVVPGEPSRTTQLRDFEQTWEILASGFEDIHALLNEGQDFIELWGEEDVAETVEIGFQDQFSIATDNYRLVVDRGDFLTTQTSIAPLTYGFGPEDALRIVGSAEMPDLVRVSLTEEINGTSVNQFIVRGAVYDAWLAVDNIYLEGAGFGNFDVDLSGGDFTPTNNVIVDWFAFSGLSANGQTEVWPGVEGTGRMSATNFSWQNVRKLGVAGAGVGTIYDTGHDDSIVFGPEEDIFFDGAFFPFNGLDVLSGDLDARFSFDETTYFSTDGFDTADISVDANTLELGLHKTRATWVDVNLTLDGVEVVNATTEHENDVASVVPDVEQLDIRVSDDRNIELSSTSTGAVVNVSTFGTVNINDDGTSTVSFLTDTSSNGTTFAAEDEVRFTQIPDSDLSFPLVGVEQIILRAGTNASNLVITGTDEDEGLALRESEIEIFGPTYAIRAIDYEELSVSGGMGNDVIGLEGEFESSEDGDELVFENANMTIRTSDFESVASVPSFEGITINDGMSQRSAVNRIELTFGGVVDIAPGAFSLIQRTDGDGVATGAVVASSFTCTKDGDTIVTISFDSHTRNGGGDLEDGNYQLTIDGRKVRRAGTGLAIGGEIVYGDSADEPFYSLFGDINGDRIVNVFDLLGFRRAYLASEGDPKYNASLDYDANGLINVFDLLPFRNNYYKDLPFA